MRTALLSLMLLSATALAFVPSAEAVKPYCTFKEQTCAGNIVCVYTDALPIYRICVIDPCYTTMCFATVRVNDDLLTTTLP